MKIEIYTKPSCIFCDKAKALLKSKGYSYQEYTIGVDATKQDVENRVKALGLSTQIRTVPQIFIENKHIGGYTDLVPYLHGENEKGA